MACVSDVCTQFYSCSAFSLKNHNLGSVVSKPVKLHRTPSCRNHGLVVSASSHPRVSFQQKGKSELSEDADGYTVETRLGSFTGKPTIFNNVNLQFSMENIQVQIQEMLEAILDAFDIGLNELLNLISGDNPQQLVPQLAGGFSGSSDSIACHGKHISKPETRINLANVFFARGPNIPKPSEGPPVTPTLPSGVPIITPLKREGIAKPPPNINRWEEKRKIRKMMEDRGIKKEPGLSRIEINGKIHAFMANDRNHPEIKEIHKELGRIVKQMYEAGYEPDTRFVLHDIDEAAKVRAINFHSEKLAMCYGFIKTPPKQTIRIIKNLRVCGDCHTATKYMSYLTGREIIMRDAFRFHHFKKGYCSCGDYW